MTERGTRLLIAVACVLGAGVGGYYFGAASSQSAVRSVEAAGDLLVPVDDMRRSRIRREGIRETLEQVTAAQAATKLPSQRFLPVEELAFDTAGYSVDATMHQICVWTADSCGPEYSWLAVARARGGAVGEVCAVALNVEPAYVSGVPLKRQGRVRCSWDLATKLNRLLW